WSLAVTNTPQLTWQSKHDAWPKEQCTSMAVYDAPMCTAQLGFWKRVGFSAPFWMHCVRALEAFEQLGQAPRKPSHLTPQHFYSASTLSARVRLQGSLRRWDGSTDCACASKARVSGQPVMVTPEQRVEELQVSVRDVMKRIGMVKA
ncbi:hypothetical protein HaLaN_31639, partial [Haematococcus lacustris]